MAYTTYPSEADKFATRAKDINDKLIVTEDCLKDINTIFKIDTDEDYLTLKTIEATEDLVDMVVEGETLLEVESRLVRTKANELENEAKALEEAKKKKEETTETKEDEEDDDEEQ